MTDYRILFYAMVALNVAGIWLIFEYRKLTNDLLRLLDESNDALAQNTADWSKITSDLIVDLKAALSAQGLVATLRNRNRPQPRGD